MGLVYATINLSNPAKPELNSLSVKCLVDSRSTYLFVPQHIATQLQFAVLETREATTADGSSHTVPYAGPVKVGFENRNCFVGTLIMGDEVLLGAVPMECKIISILYLRYGHVTSCPSRLISLLLDPSQSSSHNPKKKPLHF